MEIDNISGSDNNESDRNCVKIEQSEKVDDNKMSTKVCNKFTIDSILGLSSHNDDMAKSNRLDLIDFCNTKGRYVDCDIEGVYLFRGFTAIIWG